MIAVPLVLVLIATQLDPATGNRLTPLSDEVRFSLSADRQTYYKGERVRLRLVLRNISDHDVIGLFQLDPSLGPDVLYRRPGAAKFVTLQCFLPARDVYLPNRTIRVDEELTRILDLSVTALERSQQHFLLDAVGTYEFRIVHQDVPEDPNAILESNVVSVSVIEAPEDEQAAQEAYTTRLAYIAQIEQGPRAFVSTEDMRSAAGFIDRYNQSRYAGPVKEGLLRWLQYRVQRQVDASMEEAETT